MRKKHRRLITLATLVALTTWGCSMAYSKHTAEVSARELALAHEAIAKAEAANALYDKVNARMETLIQEAKTAKAKIEHEDRRRKTVMGVTGWSWEVANTLIDLSDKYGITVENALGVISNETGSTFDASLTGGPNSDGTHDHGLMQLNDGGTLQWLGEVALGNKNPDPYNPHQNLQMGMWYLNRLNLACHEDWECAKSRYNGDKTGQYSKRVEGHTSKMSSRLREEWRNNE